ncbi:hypothetical protein niasHS_017801 [Heterodera schachtii]|uniref:Signal recognition particle 19 kDa protein n=2 Tax=Heterodera TaxID=34509 RepID=A0ABD2I4K0_HETSC
MEVKLKPYSDPSRWVAIYPLYIDASKSLAQGRRIPKAKAVNNPTCQEIFDVLNHVGLRCELEQKKTHPRAQSRGAANPKQQQQEEGRIRVQLKGDDGENVGEGAAQPKFMTRQQMMEYAAEMVPKLKTRQQQNQGEQNDATGKQKKRK